MLCDSTASRFPCSKTIVADSCSIVESKISSALIMEDDSDWDVNLKAQMIEFARGTRILQGDKSGGSSSGSPYGDDWDMLWLGHCGMKSLQEERGEQPAFYIIPNDTTVRPPQHKMDFVNPRLAESPGFENHRLVFTGEGPICSWSLAFTYDGARKALTALSMVGVDQPVDLGYNFLCSGNLGFPIRCFSTYPSLMGTWTQQGPTSRNSDIVESDVVDWHDASSQTMVYSTMLNMMTLANNSTKIKAQWEEARQAEIDLATFEIPNGFLYFPDSDSEP